MAEERPVEELVRWEQDGGVARITLDRPEAKNALTPPMRDRLATLFEDASADPTVRAVLLTATGTGFCTGADLRGGRPPSRPDGVPERIAGDVARTIQRGWQRLVASVLDCEKPVVAAVNGTAAGGGLLLALACDVVVASRDARFICVFVRRGIAPDAGAAYLLTRLVGPQRAKRIALFGDDISAEEALAMGLIGEVVAPEELEGRATALAERLAQGPTRALAATKLLINRALDVDRGTAFLEEAWAQEWVVTTEDMREGTRAFVERRQPTFRGY